MSNRNNLTAQVGKNTVYGIVASLFQVGTRLVTVPVIIYHLGLGGYGIWSIIMTGAIYMRIGSVGIKGAFQKYVAGATGDGGYDRASQLLSTGTMGISLLSVVGLIPVVIFSRQLANAAGVPPEFLKDAAWAFSVFGITMLLSNSGAAYEAIVLGGHRIDLARKANSVLTVAEAVAIIALLHFGYGLFAMACVMAASELVYLIYCYAVAHRIVPQVHVALRFVTRKVVRELVRFAGSYQLLNILQLTYSALVPIIVLRAYGADDSGVYAVANRLAQPVMMCHNAFLLPILSGGAMVYATGESERLRRLLAKSFKVTLIMTLTPFALISVFGMYIVRAWTGQTDPDFHYAIWLMCLTLLFQSFSTLGLVLYRVGGGAVMDNVFQAIRLAALIPVIFVARAIGFGGVLGWMAGSELTGAILMFLVLEKKFHVFKLKMLLPETLRLAAATLAILTFAAIAVFAVPDLNYSLREIAAYKAGVACLAALIGACPALYLTGAVSDAEVRSVMAVFRRRRASNIGPVE